MISIPQHADRVAERLQVEDRYRREEFTGVEFDADFLEHVAWFKGRIVGYSYSAARARAHLAEAVRIDAHPHGCRCHE